MKNHIPLLGLLFLFFAKPVHAQYNPDKVPKKAQNLYNKALDMAQDDLPGAMRLLDQSIQIDPNYEEAYLSLAGMYASQKDYRKAVDNYEKARGIDSIYFRDFNLPYSIDLAGLGEFDKALEAVRDFLTDPHLNETSRKAGEYRQHCFEFALSYAATHPASGYKFEPHNLGDSINTDVSEYFPTITIDGNTLIFT